MTKCRVCHTLLFIAFLSASTQAQDYVIQAIPVNSTYHHVSARSINNQGVVVGSADASPWYGYNRGFVYANGAINFIYFGGADANPVLAINNQGNYIGQASLPGSVHKGFLNSTYLPSAFANQNFWVSDINNMNQICGWTWDGSTSRLVIHEGMQVIDVPNITFDDGVDVKAINDSGYVVGTRWETNEGFPFVYSHRDSQIVYLPNAAVGMDYPYTEAYDINNSNDVVGYYNHDNNPWGGFLWRGGAYTLFPYGAANAINDSGVVVGERDDMPTMSGGEYAFIYDSVHGSRDLNTLLPPGSGWQLLSAVDINDIGEIVGIGRLNGEVKSFIMSPKKLTVTKPVGGELLIAGERDTIRWTGGGGIDSLRIIAILNSHTVLPTEIVINESISADSAEWIWSIPDSLLSYKTTIRIEDKADPSTFAESEPFKLKGYVLTRVNPFDSTYEAYGRTKHAWQFGNTLFDMWPSAWWSRFTYRDSIDPYTNDRYDEEFHGIAASMFPDWPAFVRAYGVNQCYWSIPGFGLFYRDVATDFWKSKIGSWGGSCFGFAISSILAFQDVGGFVISYPEMPSYNNLYDFPGALSGGQGDSVRSVINSLFTHQFGKQHWDNYLLNIWGVDRPTQTLNKLKNSLINDDPDGRVLRIDNQGAGGGAHAIMVYKLTQNQSSPNLYTLSVYDNSFQTTLNATITIDTAANGGLGNWNSTLWTGWGGNIGIYLLDPAVSYFSQPIIPNGPLDEARPFHATKGDGSSGAFQINNTRNADVLISDSLGNSLGFADSALVSEIPGAIPFIPMEPSSSPPFGYQLPQGTYRVDLLSFRDTTAFLYVFDGPVTYSYWRNDAALSQEDNVTIGSGLSIASSDPQPKSIELKTTIAGPGDEKVFLVPEIELLQSDSVQMEQRDQSILALKNFGLQKNYDLRIRSTSPSLRIQFGRDDIVLNQNASHTIIPDWDDLQHKPVKILIDEGNDGTIDDSMLVKNEILGMDAPLAGIPSEFKLYQNYPNPFNATTVIEYGLPASTHVTLKVYDVLGREVATLVDEVQSAGSKQARWDASDVTSGVYYLRMTAGAFAETRKMLLMR